jgi:DNA-directed RNA polymerase subunit E'/Rpb7
MQYTALFEEQVALTPKDMSRDIPSFDELLTEKIRSKLEGKCSRHGYVISGTLKILSRSMGTMERGRFTGSILFYIQAEAEVLNPPEGQELDGIVIRKNKMGMYVSYSGKDDAEAIRVIVPRDLHIGDEDFEAVEIGERVTVQIKKSRFQINDPYILSVGMFMKSMGKSAPISEVPVEEIPEEQQEEEGEQEGEQQPEGEVEQEGEEQPEGEQEQEGEQEVEEEQEDAETLPEDEESKE